MFENKRIILASQSPRRQEILRGAGIDFTIRVVDFDETYTADIPVREVAVFLAEKKAKHFPHLSKEEILITADTTVVINDTILGKPANEEEATLMLRTLSGKTHEVITGVVIKDPNRVVSFSDTTRVSFRELTDTDIAYYLDNYKPFDKAGGYGVQEWIGMIGISWIDGSFYNVMGLPIHKVYETLIRF